MNWLIKFFGFGHKAKAHPIWMVDREGVCYLPRRKIILRSRHTT